MVAENTPASPGSTIHGIKHQLMYWIGRVAPVMNWFLGSRCSGQFGILMYHRIFDEVPGFVPPYCNVPPARFRSQLVGLLKRGYVPLALQHVIAKVTAGEELPKKTFVVTFDDGYANFLRHALPILRELQVPATLYLPTAYINTTDPFPFDHWPGAGVAPIESWRALTWDECRELAKEPLVELAAHTHWHRNYSGQPDAFRDDIAICRQVLQEQLGIQHCSFAFPYGAFDALLLRAAHQEKFSTLVTTVSRMNAVTDPIDVWHRFAVYDNDTDATIVGRLSGWYERLLTPFSRRQRARLLACREALA